MNERRLSAHRHPRQAGASYMEVLVATILLVVSLVPAMEALQTASIGADVHESQATRHYLLVSGMEEVLAEPFAALETEATNAGNPATPTLYSDAAATPDRRLVFLSPYDADNTDADNDPFTGTDDGLLWVRVEIEGTALALESLTAR